jgi:Regulator of chromosome condensation (RCC1) repeat
MGVGLGIGRFESHPSHNPEREHSGGVGIIVFTTAPSQWLEHVQKIIRIESEFMTTDVSQPRPAPGSANTVPRKGRWGWIGIGFTALIIGTYWLLQSITVLPPKVAYALGFKDRYEQQLVEEKVRRDLEIDEQMEKSGPASTEKYHFDEPSDRTFVAKLEGGVTDISPIGDVLRPDGTVLFPDQMIRERVLPTPLKLVGPEDVRLLRFGPGVRPIVRLWSNGGITSEDPEQGHNIPRGIRVGLNLLAYSDERWPFIKHPNEKGEMQDANPRNPSYPVERQITRDVTAIANGYNFALALRAGGKVWGSGGNEYGQLGNDSPSYRGFTKPIDGVQDIVGIAAGIVHGLALRKDGTVWRWG